MLLLSIGLKKRKETPKTRRLVAFTEIHRFVHMPPVPRFNPDESRVDLHVSTRPDCGS